MIVPPGLQLLDQIIADHHRDWGDDPLLLPCVHEDLDEDIQLLQAGAQRCGGTLFFLSRPDHEWEAPSGPICEERRALVEGLLGAVGDVLPAKVIIEEDGDSRVQARLEGDKKPVEPSLSPILRAAAVIASSAYEEFELILLATAVAPTDPKRRELLWRLLTIPPIDLSLNGRSPTLVPILGTSLDPQTDYLRSPPLRYVVRWDRVIRRSALSQAHAVRSIADLGERPLVLFLGAGASASAGVPLGNYYRDIALKDLVGPAQGGRQPAELLFDLLHERGHVLAGETTSRAEFVEGLTLERVLLETIIELGFRPRTEAPVIKEIMKDCAEALGFVRSGRKALREIAAQLPGQLIVMTVNFDELIEDGLEVGHSVFYRPDHYRDVERLDDLVAYASGDKTKDMPVLKLHGSIVDPDSLIATIDTTSAGLHDDVLTAMNKVLEATGKPLRWVWVGCSMRDRDMNRWLGGLGSNALDEWWVDPMPGKSLDDFFAEHRASRWGPMGLNLRDRLIIDSADGFLTRLAEATRPT